MKKKMMSWWKKIFDWQKSKKRIYKKQFFFISTKHFIIIFFREIIIFPLIKKGLYYYFSNELNENNTISNIIIKNFLPSLFRNTKHRLQDQRKKKKGKNFKGETRNHEKERFLRKTDSQRISSNNQPSPLRMALNIRAFVWNVAQWKRRP